MTRFPFVRRIASLTDVSEQLYGDTFFLTLQVPRDDSQTSLGPQGNRRRVWRYSGAVSSPAIKIGLCCAFFRFRDFRERPPCPRAGSEHSLGAVENQLSGN